ncbi:hypothetical protein AC1031_022077 [Aphanomyces cochlioides]|nr:hypothetical protein AC1031_022077 [Aphanomyces cochlioides]
MDDDVRPRFTIAEARRNRISEESRVKYNSGINQIKKWCRATNRESLLAPCNEAKDRTTLNLAVFTYDDFLQFIEWCANKPKITAGTLSGYRSSLKSLYKDQNIPLPEEYGDDLKIVFSGT